MSVAEMLSMLTVHGIDLSKPGYGGTPTITPQDVAGAMGMGHLPDEQGALLMAVYCDDRQSRHELWAHWFVAVMKESRRQGWEPKKGQIKSLVDLSFQEATEDNRCRHCKGVGETLLDSKKVVCERCEGTGRQYTPDYLMAQKLGCSRTVFKGIWAPRAQWCRRELQIWEASALYSLMVSMR